MKWTSERQEFVREGEPPYVHDGPTNTEPSHDLAHLMLAASSSLPWRPDACDRDLRLAEFFAVLLEDLGNAVMRSAMSGEKLELEKCVEEARWFVEEYYTPFPGRLEDALRMFGNGIDASSVVRLYPLFVKLRADELGDKSRKREFSVSFRAGDAPIGDGFTARAQRLLAVALPPFLAWACGPMGKTPCAS